MEFHNFDFSCTVEMAFFRPTRAVIGKWAPILLKFDMRISVSMHHMWVKGHYATIFFLNFETRYRTTSMTNKYVKYINCFSFNYKLQSSLLHYLTVLYCSFECTRTHSFDAAIYSKFIHNLERMRLCALLESLSHINIWMQLWFKCFYRSWRAFWWIL